MFVLLLLPVDQGYGQSSTIQVQTIPTLSNYGEVRVQITGPEFNCPLSLAEIHEILSIYSLDHLPEDENFPQVLGNYIFERNTFIFSPKYPPPPGLNYTIILNHQKLNTYCHLKLSESLKYTIQFPSNQNKPTTIVESIFPSSNILPVNLLRFYVHFTQPMSSQDPYRFLSIIDSDGNTLQDPFVELPEGLWNKNKTRLTVFIHPGRIKRGVGPNMTLGSVFESNSTYTLKIDSGWTDINGLPLQKSFEKTFSTEVADRSRLHVTEWKITYPPSGTLNPLILKFNKKMDSALSQRFINVMDMSNKRINGNAILKDYEREWHFTPTNSWITGDYVISINPALEDVSGNNIVHAFDVKINPDSSEQRSSEVQFERIKFRIE